jgi:nitrogen regulatory protein PII 2
MGNTQLKFTTTKLHNSQLHTFTLKKGKDMKMIIAIIRMAKMNATKKALAAVGLPSFMASGEVQGRGRGRGLGPTYQEIQNDPALAESLKELGSEPRLKTKRMITIVVSDEKLDLAVETIINTNKTGNSGDGKIFVLPAAEAIQVRTGDSGETVLD